MRGIPIGASSRRNPSAAHHLLGFLAIVLGVVVLSSRIAIADTTAQSAPLDVLGWTEWAPLPDDVGFAGPYGGVSGEALLVAGGANFPGGRPWDGHPKIWHDRIFVLEEPDGDWRSVESSLPRPLGYGVSLTWPAGDAVVCVGGGDADRHYRDAFLLRWRDGRIDTELLPPLPTPMAFGCGVLVGDTVFVFGGTDAPDAKQCLPGGWALDLADEGRRWRTLPTFPGLPRQLAMAGTVGGAIYLFGGVGLEVDAEGRPRRIDPYFRDAYRFTPSPHASGSDATRLPGEWQRVADLPRPLAGAPSPALAVGPSHLYLPRRDR
ncbi:MAG: hypothetical protein AAF488_12980, partial [Planctomycetota bacterium]